MSLHRTTLVALAILFTSGMISSATAGCCGCGGCGTTYVPVTSAPPAQFAPVGVGGCGGCGASAPVTYAEPVLQPPLPPPLPVAWGTGCDCGGSVVYAPSAQLPPIVPAPIYVADQGPYYSGPGVMIPYRTWSLPVAATNYPYISGGYGRSYYRGPRYAYGEHGHGQPGIVPTHGRHNSHRPLDVRG